MRKKMAWLRAPNLKCSIPESSILVETNKPSLTTFITINSLTLEQINMLYPFRASEDEVRRLNVHNGIEAQKAIRSFNYRCVPPIMRHVAQSKISSELLPEAEWERIHRRTDGANFSYCDKIIPRPTVEVWEYDTEHTAWVRKSEPRASRKYYLELQAAKKTFESILNKPQRSLTMNCYPEVAAHNATRYLVDGRGDSVAANE
jgi:hypothetical protein